MKRLDVFKFMKMEMEKEELFSAGGMIILLGRIPEKVYI